MRSRIQITASYDQDADACFADAIRFDELQDAMRGLATYDGFAPGAVAEAGETYVVDITLFGLFPVTAHTMYVEQLDSAARELQSRERHKGVTAWDHHLSVQPDGNGGCMWTDTVEIAAGWQTPMVARFAAYTYRYRHRKRNARAIHASVRALRA
jgi:hypothetical protein